MSLIRKHGAVLQAWACLDLVLRVVSTCLQVRNPRGTDGSERPVMRPTRLEWPERIKAATRNTKSDK